MLEHTLLVCNLFLDCGSAAGIVFSYGRLPLCEFLLCPIHSAASAGNLGVEKTTALLKAGANRDLQDNYRKTAYTGNGDVIRALLKKGADKGARDDHGRLPLHLAAVAGKHEAVK